MTASADVESQSASERTRSRCLDTFLTVSVIALFIMFAIALAGALWFAKHIESEINGRKAEELHGSTDSLISEFPGSENAYKMQNFAYLRANESELKNAHVMAWESIPSGTGHTVGSLFDYHDTQRALRVKNSGSYFLYVKLSLSCSGVCQPGEFTVSFKTQENNSPKLTCTVTMSKGNREEPFSQTCWSVVTFPEKDYRLMAKSTFPGKLDNWKLEMNESGFGMFLVDGVQAVHHT
ncbi:uncharacterized protein [Pseudorasbora parva]|uniref:uncharacterized protein n=1 Tax=Pseudorasbora parva TaxID=51549 RepID=UPI00351DCC7D